MDQYRAAEAGDLDALIVAVDPWSLNACGPRGWTAITHAAVGGHIECVQHLLRLGASLYDSSDRDGVYKSTIYNVVLRGRFDVLELLLSHAVTPAAHLNVFLAAAAKKTHFDCVRLLIDYGADYKLAFPLPETGHISAATPTSMIQQYVDSMVRDSWGYRMAKQLTEERIECCRSVVVVAGLYLVLPPSVTQSGAKRVLDMVAQQAWALRWHLFECEEQKQNDAKLRSYRGFGSVTTRGRRLQ